MQTIVHPLLAVGHLCECGVMRPSMKKGGVSLCAHPRLAYKPGQRKKGGGCKTLANEQMGGGGCKTPHGIDFHRCAPLGLRVSLSPGPRGCTPARWLFVNSPKNRTALEVVQSLWVPGSGTSSFVLCAGGKLFRYWASAGVALWCSPSLLTSGAGCMTLPCLVQSWRWCAVETPGHCVSLVLVPCVAQIFLWLAAAICWFWTGKWAVPATSQRRCFF